jgi:phospholipid transport system substrate-binding protein
MKRAVLTLCLVAGLASTPQASISPDRLVQQTTDKVLSELTENRDTLEQKPERLYRMVREIVLPHFDFERMSQYVLGKHWKEIGDKQRQEFIGEFRTLLVRTYASALFKYTGQEIVYKPYQHEEGNDRALVKTEVVPDDGPSIPIHYALVRDGDAWKVYDVKIDGLSLVTNYRAQYSRTIQTRGIDSLIASLSKKNEKLAKDQ